MQAVRTQITIDRPILRRGAQGLLVRELQMLLKEQVSISGLVVDGIFGEITELAVKVFQFRVFLKEDGIVGSKTWKSLYARGPVDKPVLKRGSQCEEVARVQRVLSHQEGLQGYLGSDEYYTGAIDGIFGARTEAAVKAFEHNSNIRVDGIIGPQTWEALSSLAAFISHLSL